MVRLDGQVALVTGAGRGIGRAIALTLGKAGAAVAVCARSDVTVFTINPDPVRTTVQSLHQISQLPSPGP